MKTTARHKSNRMATIKKTENQQVFGQDVVQTKLSNTDAGIECNWL